MVYAIVEAGGKQMRVEPGRFYDVELMDVEVESTISIDRVLMVRHDDGIVVGQPVVSGATVQMRVLQHGKAAKVIIYKMRPKKGYRRKNGHRQRFTRLLVEAIEFDGRSFKAEAVQVEAPEAVEA